MRSLFCDFSLCTETCTRIFTNCPPMQMASDERKTRTSVYERNSQKLSVLFGNENLHGDESHTSPFLQRLVTMLPIKEEHVEIKSDQRITLMIEDGAFRACHAGSESSDR